MFALAGMWVSLLGGPLPVNRKQVADVFAFIAKEGNDYFTREQYFLALQDRPHLLQLFDLNNQRVVTDRLLHAERDHSRLFRASAAFAAQLALSLRKLRLLVATAPSQVTPGLLQALLPEDLPSPAAIWDTLSPARASPPKRACS